MLLGSSLSVLGLNLRFRISQIYSEEVLGSLAFRTRIFSSSGFHRGPQTERCLQFAPFIFQKNRIHAFKFFQKINMQRNTHTTHKKNTYLILTFRWGCRFTNQLPLGNNLNSRSTGEISGTLSCPVLPLDSTGE